MAKTKKLPAKFAKYPIMGEIADQLHSAIKKHLKAEKHPFHKAGWESPPPPAHLSDYPKGSLAARWYVVGRWTLCVEVYDGKIVLDYSHNPTFSTAKTKRREYDITNADFDIHIADFLGQIGKCYFSPLWFRASVDAD